MSVFCYYDPMDTEPTKLIIVPGHAAFKKEVALPLPPNVENDDLWVLQSFQASEPHFYIEHIKKGLELIDEKSLLIFSGGRTRAAAGEFWSEAKTYSEIAKSFSPKASHAVLEEYARDSYQNLEYSLLKFKSLTGYTPSKVLVVGWSFKADRYKFHADTLGIPTKYFQYVGVNNPTESELDDALRGELKTLNEFKAAPFGDTGMLLEKRLQRDPWGDGEPTEY